MIALTDVTVTYQHATPLDHVTCTFEAPSCAVMGPSGSGKSTLLRVVAGLQRASSGTVTIDGKPVRMPTWSSAGDPRVALIHQDYRLVEFLDVEKNVRLAAELRGIRVADTDVASALERVGLSSEFVARRPQTLSGGEQQRVAIARALLCDVDVLLADEPTGALDEANTRRVAALLRDIGTRDGVTVIVATHDRTVADALETTYEIATSGERATT